MFLLLLLFIIVGLSYDLTGSYRVAHISIAASWLLAAVLLIPLALGSPSFIFQPWYCCHRDYTTVQSSEDLRHKDTGTSATYLPFERRDDESSSSKVWTFWIFIRGSRYRMLNEVDDYKGYRYGSVEGTWNDQMQQFRQNDKYLETDILSTTS